MSEYVLDTGVLLSKMKSQNSIGIDLSLSIKKKWHSRFVFYKSDSYFHLFRKFTLGYARNYSCDSLPLDMQEIIVVIGINDMKTWF